MTRGQWKDIFEIVGGVAIVASLIFVGLETRNSANQAELTRQALEISAYQELINSISEQSAFFVENPDVRSALAKAETTLLSELTREERSLVGIFLFMRFRHGDMAYFQYERGVINDDRLRTALNPIRAMLRHRYVQNWWSARRDGFVEPYSDYINSMIDEVKSSDPGNSGDSN